MSLLIFGLLFPIFGALILFLVPRSTIAKCNEHYEYRREAAINIAEKRRLFHAFHPHGP